MEAYLDESAKRHKQQRAEALQVVETVAHTMNELQSQEKQQRERLLYYAQNRDPAPAMMASGSHPEVVAYYVWDERQQQYVYHQAESLPTRQ